MITLSLTIFGTLVTLLNAAIDPTSLGCNNYNGQFAPGYCSVYARNASTATGFASYSLKYECQDDHTMLAMEYDSNDCTGTVTVSNVTDGDYLCGEDENCGFYASYTFANGNCDTDGVQILSGALVTDVCIDFSGRPSILTCDEESYKVSVYTYQNCSTFVEDRVLFNTTASSTNGSDFSYAIYCSDVGSLGPCSDGDSDDGSDDDAAQISFSNIDFAVKLSVAIIGFIAVSSSV